MPKYIERYEDTKRPIRFRDKVKIINGQHKGKIGYVGAKDPDGLPIYNIWFEDGTFDCFMSDEIISAEENIVDLQIIAEHGACTELNDVLVRYKDLCKNCIIEKWYKFYETQFGRYIKIKGKRYYIDGKYKYRICEKGDDFDFADYRVTYHDSEFSQLVLKPIKILKVKDFKRTFKKNGVLEKYEEIFNKLDLWNEQINEIRYTDYGDVHIYISCYDDIISIRPTKKDATLFESLEKIYFVDQYGEEYYYEFCN